MQKIQVPILKKKSTLLNNALGVFLSLLIIFILMVSGILYYINDVHKNMIESNSLEFTRLYSEAISEFRTIYTKDVVSRLKDQDIKITHDFENYTNAIPLPATLSMKLGKRIAAHRNGALTKLYSPYPFPWRKDQGGLQDQFAKDAWKFLAENPDKSFYRFEEYNGKQVLRYATADVLRETCVGCHNNHSDTPKTGWKQGDVRGVLEVINPLDNILVSQNNEFTNLIIFLLVLSTIMISIIFLMIYNLRKQKNAALHASKAKSIFLANMSHEIRTPMNGILGILDILKNTPLNPKQSKLVQKGYTSARNLLDIINDILDFSKLEAGQFNIENIEINLREELENLLDFLQPKDQNNNLTLAITFDSSIPKLVKTDPTKIKQILTNLIGNAIKFTSEGYILCKVNLIHDNSENYSLEFIVTDTGIGMTDQQLENIFKEFEQADNSTTRIYGGTGLGLSICKKIVSAMGGSISATSTPGVGTSFKFDIKINLVEHTDSKSVNTSNKKILLITNTSDKNQIIPMQLDSWKYAYKLIDGFSLNKTNLIQYISENENLGCILVDIDELDPEWLNLNDILELCKEHDNLPVLVITQNPDEVSKVNSSLIRGVIAKPIMQSKLYNCIMNLLIDNDSFNLKTTLTEETAISQFGLNVLVVEDNLVNQAVAEEMLEFLGCNITIADNGQIALELIAEHEFDVVFMDCQMPILDGYSTTQKIRENEAKSDSNVRQLIIALTANAFTEDLDKCLSVGMDDFLAKPFELQQLQTILAKHFETKSQVFYANDTNEIEMQTVSEISSTSHTITDNNLFDQAIVSRLKSKKKANSTITLFHKLVKLYLKDSEIQMTNLRNAVASENHNEVKLAAHSLKSSSANIGALHLSELFKQLEAMCKDEIQPISSIRELCEQIEASFKSVCAALISDLDTQEP